MRHTFQQQQRPSTQDPPKSAPLPQHGRKLDPDAARIVELWRLQPRPGH